ncbi:MAG: iron-sulfur cluster assembly protein, partial [Bradymonadaceae bacterium]
MNDSSEAPDSVAAGEYWQYLRDVPAPNADRDVVEAGLIRSLEREDGVVSVEIDAAACLSEEAFIDLVSDIRAAVSEPTDCDRVRVTRNTGATRRNTPSAGDSEPP